MRKILAGIVAIMIGATSALAAPATPVFNKPVKLGEGYISTMPNKRMLFSGTTVYAGFAGADGAVRIAKSDNNGTTWGSVQVLQSPGEGVTPDAASVRLAISNDPLQKGMKIVHAAWQATDSNRIIVYYAYLTSRPKQSGWSKPVKLDLGPLSDINYGSGTSLAVSSSGAVHILHNTRYVSTASFDVPFGSPGSLPEQAEGATYMVMDADNNLYATYVNGSRQLRMTKKAASSAEWSPPVTVHETGTEGLSSNHDLIVLNPTTYCIGIYEGIAGKGEAALLVTTDGGTTWTKRSVYANEVDGDNHFSVAVSPGKVITFASEIYDAQGKSVIKVWRSNDNGVTWSKPATVKGEKLPNIALDSAGKAHMLVMDETGSAQSAKLLWIKEK